MVVERVTDQSRRLNQEEGDELRALLHFLKYDAKHSLKDIASRIGCSSEDLYKISSRRSRGTVDIRDRVHRFAQSRRVPIDASSRVGIAYGVRSDLNISDEGLIKDGSALAGRYFAFTLLNASPRRKVGVMLLSLYDKEEGRPFTQFAGWRPDDPEPIQHRGVYYRFDGGLYLVGNTLGTGYPRLVSVQPEPNDENAWFGMVASASRADLAFHSWIYLKRIDEKLIRLARRKFSDLGVFDMTELAADHPEVVVRFEDKQVHTIGRPSAEHG